MKFSPHLHCLVTGRGFKKNGEWADMNFFPYEMLRRSWQYQLLTNLKKEIADTPENRKLIDTLFKEHPEGFHVRAEDTINIRGGNRHYVTMTVEGFISPSRHSRNLWDHGPT